MGWENDSGEQDLILTALDVAKWLNASPELVETVMEDMGWPDATSPEILSKISAEVERRRIPPSVAGKTETFQSWTQADETVLRLGGFQAVVAFNFLSEADKAEALKNIKKFVEFTLSKYEQQDNSQNPSQSTPSTSEGADTTPSSGVAEVPPEGE
ncbi:MAG: hypothetical protein K2M15_08320 [Oscillospiraceae bacterium]|nr:hypothetical protein [Oscillospiraceae bacterium]MDE7170328.1 hypothetical protein [Oscillospiraceae bacterium]